MAIQTSSLETLEQAKQDFSEHCALCKKRYGPYEIGCRVDPYDPKKYCNACWTKKRMGQSAVLIWRK
jgi:hypothetical protein